MSTSKRKYTRRGFLKSALVISSGAVAGSLLSTQPVFGSEVKDDKSMKVNLSDYEALTDVGAFVVIKEVQIGGQTDNLIIVHKSETEYLVFSSVCRHKKCNVKYKKEKAVFVCPCHGSTYDLTGKVMKGPSTQNIPQYKVQIKDGALIITAI